METNEFHFPLAGKEVSVAFGFEIHESQSDDAVLSLSLHSDGSELATSFAKQLAPAILETLQHIVDEIEQRSSSVDSPLPDDNPREA